MSEVRRYPVPRRAATVLPCGSLRSEAARQERSVRTVPSPERVAQVVQKPRVRREAASEPLTGELGDDYRHHVALFEEHEQGRVDGPTMASILSMSVLRVQVETLYEVLTSAPGRSWLSAPELRRCLAALRRISELDFDVSNRGGPPVLNEPMRLRLGEISEVLGDARRELRADLEAIEVGDEDLHELDPTLPTNAKLAHEVIDVMRASTDNEVRQEAQTLAEMPERVVSITEAVLERDDLERSPTWTRLGVLMNEFDRYRHAVDWDLGTF